MNKFYQFEQSEKKADLYIFGRITSYPWDEKEKDAYGIVKELQDSDAEEIDVHINSMGGAVAEGLAIYNVLKNHSAKITTYCDGFACSAASVIFMAGDERVMNEASLLMIHNAWTYGQGNAKELRKQADDLDTISQASVNAYKRVSNLSEEEIKEKMDEETWISAKDAKEWGFATSVLEEDEDGVNQSVMQMVKEKLLHKEPESVEENAIDLEELAEQIAESVAEKLKPAPQTEPVLQENGWGKFFNA